MDAFIVAFGFFSLVDLESIPLAGLILWRWLIQARQSAALRNEAPTAADRNLRLSKHY
jgi:hypothetical protein